MLESAINSPVNHEHYGQKDLFVLAGVLAEKIALDHSYQDGNKRTALYAADMFLKMNGHQLQKRPEGKSQDEFNEELSDAHVFVATRRWTPEDLGNYYRSIAQASINKNKES
ncbi:Fido domain-containing protein [Fusarium sp. LHS14.1]|nr:Fido domain-containing protein [Fusarium sp. LHS14.1]